MRSRKSPYFQCFFVMIGWLLIGTAYAQPAPRGAQDSPEPYVVQGQTQVLQSSQELTVEQALRLAEKASPDLQATLERETQSKAATGIQSAYYYPHLDAAGVNSSGFPASGAPAPSGFGGMITSPYRSGAGVDINATWTLFDASQWNKLKAFRYQEHSSRAQTYVTRMRVDEQVLELYFNAALYRGQKETWKEIVDMVEPIIDTVKHFVRSGRYNEVQLLLLQNQEDDAKLKEDTYDKQYQWGLKRLGLALAQPAEDLQVPKPSDMGEQSLAAIGEMTQNPLLDYAQSEAKAAKALASSASAERLPRLYVTGSVGSLEGTRLVNDNSSYSGWAGISVPLFEGFSIDNEVNHAQSAYREKSDQLAAAKLEVDDLNAQYDQAIQTAQMKIAELAPQYEAARRNFTLAKERYLNFLGTVTDLEESLRNLAEAETETNAAKMDLLLAEALKKLSNGAMLKAEK